MLAALAPHLTLLWLLLSVGLAATLAVVLATRRQGSWSGLLAVLLLGGLSSMALGTATIAAKPLQQAMLIDGCATRGANFPSLSDEQRQQLCACLFATVQAGTHPSTCLRLVMTPSAEI